jgi:hypothetical protein
VGKLAASTTGGRLADADAEDDGDGLDEAAGAAVELGGVAPPPLHATAIAFAMATRNGAEGFGRVPIAGA